MVPSPIEDKPPLSPAVSNKNGLQLVLENHVNKNGGIHLYNNVISNGATNNNNISYKKIIKNSTLASADSSDSSLNSTSDIPSVHGVGNTPSVEKPKIRIANGTGKQATLKRVSFGSSKGSMVETLIYETPVQEEPEPSRLDEDKTDETDLFSGSEGVKLPSNKVRVSFFESTDKKYVVTAPENFGNNNCSDDFVIYEQFIMSSPSQSCNTTLQCSYDRQESTDSGWDNPFRPDGDLSKEADEIVELIKEGKPITPTQGSNLPKLIEENDATKTAANQNFNGSKVNGNANLENSVVTGVEVQHGTIATPTDASQVEHVVIKKKQKCLCCNIQ